MIYGPRDAAAVDDVVSVIEESISFARGGMLSEPRWSDP